ncbi:MAG: hypothetical protein H6711_34045 [Myxococcales bacterium]|nr:hypothetical protein [Myxococcales bacterium]
MSTLALAALFCCIVPALSVAVGGVVDVAQSHALKREVLRAFASTSRAK